jgi:hypothetical protein
METADVYHSGAAGQGHAAERSDFLAWKAARFLRLGNILDR